MVATEESPRAREPLQSFFLGLWMTLVRHHRPERKGAARGRDPAAGDWPPGTGADANKRVVLDYRFPLANERTFLAWMRTCLALMAAAAAVIQFARTWGLGSFARRLD